MDSLTSAPSSCSSSPPRSASAPRTRGWGHSGSTTGQPLSSYYSIQGQMFSKWNWVFRLGNKVITKMEMLRTLVLLGHIQVKITLFLSCPFHDINARLTWQCWRRRRKWNFQMRLRICSGDLGTVVISVYFDHLSLMDFAHDDRISEGEFLRATGHYRWYR